MNRISGLPNYFEQQDIDLTNINSETITNTGLIQSGDIHSSDGQFDHIVIGDASTGSLSSVNCTITSLACEDYKYKNTAGDTRNNRNTSYTTANSLWYSFQPVANTLGGLNGPYLGLKTLLSIPNAELKVGSILKLSMGLTIEDNFPASGNYVEWSMQLGASTNAPVLFTTNPPHNPTTHIQIETTLVVVAKSAYSPVGGNYDFVIVSKYTDTNSTSRTLVWSGLEQAVGYLATSDCIVQYSYKLNGTSTNVIFNRGAYSLYQVD